MIMTLTDYPKIFFNNPGLHVLVAHTTNKENVEKFLINVAAQYLLVGDMIESTPVTVAGSIYDKWEERLAKLKETNQFMYERYIDVYNSFVSINPSHISQFEAPGETNYKVMIEKYGTNLSVNNNCLIRTAEDILNPLHEWAMIHNIPVITPAYIDPKVLDITSKSFLKNYESVLLMPELEEHMQPIMPFYHRTLPEGNMVHVNTAEYLF